MEGFQVFGAGALDDVLREVGGGWGFIPGEGFQIIADELFIEAGGADAEAVFGLRPEPGGVWGEALVNEDDLVVPEAEFEFGIGDEDAFLGGVGAAGFVEADGVIANDLSGGGAEDLAALFPGDVFVVTAGGLGGRGEEGLGQGLGLLQSGGEGESADALVGLVFFPTGAGEVAAHDAFHGKGLGLFHEHGSAAELSFKGAEGFR